jgi:hypothetical protein
VYCSPFSNKPAKQRGFKRSSLLAVSDKNFLESFYLRYGMDSVHSALKILQKRIL